jgi:hypothetical protein
MSHKLSWVAAVYKLLMAGVLFASASLNFGPSVALADTYNWSFNGGSTNNYSGSLITGAADMGGFDITSITGSGTINGSSVTITGPTHLESDNILFPNASPQLDVFGVSFVGSPGSVEVNISCVSGSCFQFPAFGSTSGTFTATLVPSVPGPIAGAGLPGLILAGGGLLGWWRRRKKIA